MPKSDVHIPLAFDSNALIGAHVTMRSALAHLNPSARAVFHCYGPSLSPEQETRIRHTLDTADREYVIRFATLSPSRFQHMKWLGGFATYLRIVIPEVSDTDRLVYLDADLLVFADLAELFAMPLGNQLLGAVSWHHADISNDKNLFKRLGQDSSALYFNCEVLLIDAAKRRQERITRRCLELGDQYGKALPTADQTILNLVFHKALLPIPKRFNTPVAPGRAPLPREMCSNRVIHFVSRPKPWDPLGWLNGQHRVFCTEVEKTALGLDDLRRGRAPFGRVIRWWRPYVKCTLGRLAGCLKGAG